MQMEIDMRLFPFDTQRLNIVLGWDLSGGHPASKKPGLGVFLMDILLMVQKSGEHQLILGRYPIIYDGFQHHVRWYLPYKWDIYV